MNKLIVCNGAAQFGIKSNVKVKSELFGSGEINIRIKESVRDKDITIIQTFNRPNTEFFELMMTIDACKRAGASTITLILPLFPYSRQDRRHTSGVAISAKVVCDMLRSTHINRIITFDLHADQIAGFLPNNIQFDNIYMTSFWKYHLQDKITSNVNDWCFCSPDAGSIKRTRLLANACGSGDLAFINKRRDSSGKLIEMNIIGEVQGKNCILPDDMADSGGTMAKAYDLLKEEGANQVIMLATHGIFSGNAMKNLKDKEVWVTDSCRSSVDQVSDKNENGKIEFVSLKPFINDIYNRIINGSQMSDLFSEWVE